MANQKIIPHYLIPPGTLRNIYISNKEEFIFLGSNNLKACQRYWEGEKKKNDERIMSVKGRINVLLGRGVDSIKKLASEYDNPELEVAIRQSGEIRANETEPTYKDSKKLKSTTTTLNVCGWCEYNSQSYYRRPEDEPRPLTMSCLLLPQVFDDIGGGLHFDTPCLITNGSLGLLDACRNHLRAELLGLLEKESIINGNLEFIKSAIIWAEKKPLFPEFRDIDSWVTIGTKLVFVESSQTILEDCEVTHTVKENDTLYIAAEGFSPLFLNFRQANIMKSWEYEYFKTHPDYLKLWIEASEVVFDRFGEQVDLIEAYAKKTLEEKSPQ